MFRQISEVLELGYYIETNGKLSDSELKKLRSLIAETYEPEKTGFDSRWKQSEVTEIGPRLSIESPFSSNAVAICRAMNICQIARIEQTRRHYTGSVNVSKEAVRLDIDRMTEQYYSHGIATFDANIAPEPVKIVGLIEQGKTAIEEINKKLGLGMDNFDIEYYYDLFVNIQKRNPKDVGLVQLGNANSEHSRHGYFKGKQIIDGEVMPKTLFEIVKRPLQLVSARNNKNCSLAAFRDNAGVIRGFKTKLILPETPGLPSPMRLCYKIIHITCTAETHNHPTAVAPFPGAETGVGGRERDTCAVGRGGWTGIGAGGYFVGNLFVPEYEIPGENVGRDKPSKYASPLSILIEGSNGVSSYGNKFGEPLTLGFCRTFGQEVDGEWIEPRKPVLYSGGIGHIFNEHLCKENPEVGMIIVAIGGPAYSIGVCGGSASSMTQGQNTDALDYNSVQRGNPEMENKTNRVIRACAEMGDKNPIASIHDQGAGGPSNVLTELMEPLGGKINIRKIVLGDKTMSVLQIWSAEYQERYGLLIRPEHLETFQSICERERVNCEVLGEITGDGKVVVEDPENNQTPVDLNLGQILTKIPQKTFESTRKQRKLKPLKLPEVTLAEAIEKVFRLPSVGSKGFLVHKVDRSVTGLVAQQQCCGIAQIPIADNSVNTQSCFDLTGAVSSIGENPIRMLIDPKAGARMIVGEVLTNMASVLIRSIEDIRCRANWMWPAKLPNEGPRLFDAAKAMSDLMVELGMNGLEIAPDGGKDSLSLAATVQGKCVKAPGSLAIFGYAPVPDITKKVTPDIKRPGESAFGLIDLRLGKNRLGGSALAQAFNQLGDESPDIDDPKLLRNAFLAVRQMIIENLILAIHDRSDGGLITAVAEMCMASRCGFGIGVKNADKPFPELFSDELGIVLEIDNDNVFKAEGICNDYGVPFEKFGRTIAGGDECIVFDRTCAKDKLLLRTDIWSLRTWWESTSHQIEKLQMNPACADEEYLHHASSLPRMTEAPSYKLTFTPKKTPQEVLRVSNKPRVAIVCEEGTNGDREMRGACYAAGLDPWDVYTKDLIEKKVALDLFRGIIFPGGFSFMDVFGSAKGWAETILSNQELAESFHRFYDREDTFSLGVCNGCQLMALLGWVPFQAIERTVQPRFIQNTSGRFESRWVQVEVLPSPSILLSGMDGSKLGCYIAHGEGKLFYPAPWVKQMVERGNLSPLAYLDPRGNRTEQYPYNPNGSPDGITALCSLNGRHLAMMPHPERCFRLWQWPWMPASWKYLEASPWLRMFQNARKWCVEH